MLSQQPYWCELSWNMTGLASLGSENEPICVFFRSQVWLTMSFAFDDVCWPSGLLPTMKGRGKENKMQKKTAYFVLRCILYSHQNLSAVRQMIVCHRINAWLHARQSVKYNMIFQKCQQVITMILIALLHVSIINRGIEWQAIHSQLFIKELTSQGRTDEWHVTRNKLTAQVITRPRKYQPCPKHVTESMFDISTWNAENHSRPQSRLSLLAGGALDRGKGGGTGGSRTAMTASIRFFWSRGWTNE